MANKDTAKTYLQTGDYPTEAQFAQICEWQRWKDEMIAIADVVGLQNILNALSTPVQKFIVDVTTYVNYTIPVGFVQGKLYIIPTVSAFTTIRDTDAAVNLFVGVTGVDDIDPAKGAEYDISVFAATTARNIRVGPLPVGSTVYIVKTKLF